MKKPNRVKHIIQASIPRCGSTMVWQVLSQLYPKKVSKTHDYKPNGSHICVTVRDFRDVMVSTWRVDYDIPLKELDKGRKMTKKDIEKFIKRINGKVHNVIDRYKAIEKNRDNIIFLRYEQFYRNHDVIFDGVERLFGIKIVASKKKQISSFIDVRTNRDRASKFTSFHNRQWDKNNIHGLHIYSPEPGNWVKLVPAEYHQMVEDGLHDALKRWDYVR